MTQVFVNVWAVLVIQFGSLFCLHAWGAETAEIAIQVDQPGIAISPQLYGLMTEEINHAYDGGLYAELIQNRAFRDSPRTGTTPNSKHPPHWMLVKTGGADGSMSLDDSEPVNETALPTSLRLDRTASGGRIGVANDGYWGIPLKPNTKYRVSFYARSTEDF